MVLEHAADKRRVGTCCKEGEILWLVPGGSSGEQDKAAIQGKVKLEKLGVKARGFPLSDVTRNRTIHSN